MHISLEAVRGIAGDTVATTGVPHRNRIKGRGFKDEIRRRLANARECATLHARERDGAVAVCNHQIAGREFDFLRIGPERQKRFAVRRAAHMNLAACEGGEIEDVRRLAEFKEDEVGGVDDVVARDLPDRNQSTL